MVRVLTNFAYEHCVRKNHLHVRVRVHVHVLVSIKTRLNGNRQVSHSMLGDERGASIESITT